MGVRFGREENRVRAVRFDSFQSIRSRHDQCRGGDRAGSGDGGASGRRRMLFPVDLFGRPAQGDTDIAGHTVRIVNDREAEAIALGLELALPELVELLGLADQRLLPTRLGLVDGASVVGAERMGKTEDLDRMLSALDGSIDEDRRLFKELVVREAGRIAELLDKLLLGFLLGIVRLLGSQCLLPLLRSDLRCQLFCAQYGSGGHAASPVAFALTSAGSAGRCLTSDRVASRA